MGFRSTLIAFWTAGKGTTVGLTGAAESRDPLELFEEWFDAAKRSGLILPEAMTLATATASGEPSARMVLLKGYGLDGFVFYTNYESRKSKELEANPRAALLFHWPVLQRQIRIEGPVERTTTQESRAYFETRGRGSKIGAWASDQSQLLTSRQEMEQRFQDLKDKFSGSDILLPEFWGGYRLIPESIEFWQGRLNRLHDRLLFERHGDSWTRSRLQP